SKAKDFFPSASSSSPVSASTLSPSTSSPSHATTKRWKWATIARRPRRETFICAGLIIFSSCESQNNLGFNEGALMPLNVSAQIVWAGDIPDAPGGLAEKVAALAASGANL